MTKAMRILIPCVVIIILFIGGYTYWLHNKHFPSTDDAYLSAHVVNIAPQISGQVLSIEIHNHQFVHRGQLLFKIDPKPYQIAVNQAQAKLANTRQQLQAADMAVKAAAAVVRQREAELINTRHDTKRNLTLVNAKYLSSTEGDLAIKNLRVAKAALAAAKSQLAEAKQKRGSLGEQNAQLRSAEAELAKAQLNLHYTHIYAPQDGYIANFSLRPGDAANAYQSLFALIENNYWWVSANFKETQLTRMHIGQPAIVLVDMYPGHRFHGKVISISDNSGTSFSLIPAENAAGNWVKVTQRFPVRILITDRNRKFPLRLGASTTVTVNTIGKS